MIISQLLTNKIYTYKKVLEKLIAHRVEKNPVRVLAHLDYEISDSDLLWIQENYDAYNTDKQPLEYILGYVEFLGHRFMVNRHTLIPRPETEYMIQAVVQELTMASSISGSLTPDPSPNRYARRGETILIDVGTGCGVLGLSCILHASAYIDRVYMTDYYPDTLDVARQNLVQKKQELTEKHTQEQKNSREQAPELIKERSEAGFSEHGDSTTLALLESTQLLHCSLLDHPILQETLKQTNSPLEKEGAGEICKNKIHKNIIIVANLPYIPEQLFEDNVEDNVKLREPKPAFVGGEDGLDWYRQMLEQVGVGAPLGKGGRRDLHLTLFLEMMTRQVDILAGEFREHFTFESVATFHMNIRIVKCIYMG